MMVSPALFVLKRCSKDGLNGNKRTCVRKNGRKNGVSKACLLDSLRGILLSEPRTRAQKQELRINRNEHLRAFFS
jgi:hypothetical protein